MVPDWIEHARSYWYKGDIIHCCLDEVRHRSPKGMLRQPDQFKQCLQI
jgi:hypothetical protein